MSTKPIHEQVDNFDARRQKYPPVAANLRELYGYPTWRPHLEPVDELVNCILSQSTTDTNRDRAYEALRERYPTWEMVRDAPTDDVIETIRSAGLANQKGPRIQEALRRIDAARGEITLDFLDELPLDEARAWLTALPGVGLKTAAIVLCFAFNRPAFPVDTHVHRLSKRIGFIPETMNAEKAHAVMEAIVPPDDYYAFHLNLIRHGREICHARQPLCQRCPLQNHCDYYQQV
ncbi:MAG: endonuclease III [Chloroflexi bacterium]|nr:MAG: endonuclease III [Chloroflexota bacterium]